MRALPGATYETIIQMAEQVYQGEWTLAPRMLSCHQQDKCMRIVADIGQTKARAGLWGAGVTWSSRSRRCCWGHSVSWTHSPSAEPQTGEATKWPRDSPPEWSGSWRWCSWLRCRSSSRWHQSPSPECWRQSSPLSPSLRRSGPLSEQLCLHMWNLKLQDRTRRFRSRAWQGRAPTPSKKAPRSRSNSTLMKSWEANPPCPLAWHFSCPWERPSSDITPTPAKMGPVDTLQPDHEEGPQ